MNEVERKNTRGETKEQAMTWGEESCAEDFSNNAGRMTDPARTKTRELLVRTSNTPMSQ